ncbi:ATP-binding response regulator [Desulfovulcanus sp.]
MQSKALNRWSLTYKIMALSLWTLLLAMLVLREVYHGHESVIKFAKIEARSWWKKDVIYRLWNAMHGGVYAPVTDITQPNPYLNIQERDIVTPLGKRLTLINPAYMTRQVYEIAKKELGVVGHITSLKPIRPQNKPDEWETKALKAFERGQKEYSTVVEENGKKYLRFMKPLIVQQACLKCHRGQGYKVGDMCGGISLKIPMEIYFDNFEKYIRTEVLGLLMIWIVGAGFFLWVARVVERYFQEIQIKKRELENIYQSFDRLKIGVFIVDRDYRIRHMNQTMKEWFGDQTGKICYEFLFGLSSPCVNCNLQKIGENQEIHCYDLTLLDGRTFEIWETSIINADGSLSKLDVMNDITERKRFEQEQLKLEKLESLGILAGGIAHDFNNILTGLFGNIELAKLKIHKDHPAYTHLETANKALESATNLTKQLLTFARGGVPVLEVVDLKTVIQKTVKFHLSGSNVKAHFILPDDLWQIKADEGQISQVIANLTINAKQAMPDGGNLYIEAKNIKEFKESVAQHLSGDFVRFTIRDEGVGIPAKYIDRIFDPYFTTKETGSGLGLAIVHSIIRKHNGYIRVESTRGVGTTFIIYLPVENSSHEPSTTSINVTEKPKSASGHILVMDDEEMLRDVMAELLELCGCTVDFAADGKEAIEKYVSAKKNGKPFDVVIMDLTIPGGMGGKEAVKELLAIDPKAKVIVSSGYSTGHVMVKYNEYGFKGRLFKPFQMDDLKTELSRVMKME